MSRIHIAPSLSPLLFGIVLLSGLVACERHDTGAEKEARRVELDQRCTQEVGANFLYQTAAGFRLAVPKRAVDGIHSVEYATDCQLQGIRIVFAWVGGKLLPASVASSHDRAPALALPERYESLVVMMRFKPPEAMVGPEHWEYCRGLHPQFDYPDFKLRMCPLSEPAHGSRQPGFLLPYRPRFEVVGEKSPPYSLTCPDHIFANLPPAKVADAVTGSSCRGYWYWRPGAAAMFDIDAHTGLKEFHRMLPAAEKLLDAWIRNDPAGARSIDGPE